jgi:Na+-transporting methylmalonyl-CoA/oxaloacetate decarboxylase gamma subunit
MARKSSNFDKFKSSVLTIVSGVAFVFILWMLLYGKIKATGLLSPIIGRLPKNEEALVDTTEDILGTAVQKAKDGGVKRTVERGSEVFEESKYAEPARDLRDDVREKIDGAVESAKELPAKELKLVQKEICTQWFGDEIFIATDSGE